MRKYRYRITILNDNQSLIIAYESTKRDCELWRLVFNKYALSITFYDLFKRRYIKL